MPSSILRCTSLTSCQAAKRTLTAGESGEALLVWPFSSPALDHLHHLAQRDLLRRLDEVISAGRPANAGHQPGPLQLQQDLHEEPRRNVVPLGDLANADRLADPYWAASSSMAIQAYSVLAETFMQHPNSTTRDDAPRTNTLSILLMFVNSVNYHFPPRCRSTAT